MKDKKRKTKKLNKVELPVNQIVCGHNIREMRKFSDNSIDSIVTDPPYGLEFMGKEWDKLGAKIGSTTERWSKEGLPSIPSGRVCYGKSTKSMQHWHYRWAKECLRVAKPGAFMLVFGGTRTFHRLVCAIEDAGWQIRDCMMWLYGSGFPKSFDISKAIDKAKGKKRKVIGRSNRAIGRNPRATNYRGTQTFAETSEGREASKYMTAPASKLAQLWDGYGTALKPAWEPIIVAMKPVDSNFAKNAEKYGVAGLNIDGGRIESGSEHCRGKVNSRNLDLPGASRSEAAAGMYAPGKGFIATDHLGGRWPANVILDEEAAKILDKQSEKSQSRKGNPRMSANAIFHSAQILNSGESEYSDSGGASRFFYIAKSSRSERNAGLSGMPLGEAPGSKRSNPAKGRKSALGKARENFHPTVKPLQLMQYLCMLLKMPNKDQIILDPFAGSGTTCIACKELGINYIGIDNKEDYCIIARKRLKNVKPGLFEKPKKMKTKTKKKESFGL